MALQATVEGDFSGFDDGAVFRLSNGEVWQQARYKYHYHYAHRPTVVIERQGSGHVMHVPCMNDAIEVERATMVTEGTIVSEFTGFKSGMLFQFNNGEIWQQTEHLYEYHYSYRPEAAVMDGIDVIKLHIEGIDTAVQVRRVR